MYGTVNAQTIKSIAISICDSINKIECSTEKECASMQRSIYNEEMLKYPTLVVDITDLNKPHQYNEFNYKINRDLIKSCDDYIDQFSLLPLTKILDVEGLFSRQQYDSLERLIIEFIHLKKIDLVIVSIDDTYPYLDLEEYSHEILIKLKIGSRYAGGGFLLLLSKNMNIMMIKLSDKTLSIIDQEQLDHIIHESGIPEFNRKKYFNAIYQSILSIKEKI